MRTKVMVVVALLAFGFTAESWAMGGGMGGRRGGSGGMGGRGGMGGSGGMGKRKSAKPFKKWQLPAAVVVKELDTSLFDNNETEFSLKEEQEKKIEKAKKEINGKKEKLSSAQTTARAAYQRANGKNQSLSTAQKVVAVTNAIKAFHPQKIWRSKLSSILKAEQWKTYMALEKDPNAVKKAANPKKVSATDYTGHVANASTEVCTSMTNHSEDCVGECGVCPITCPAADVGADKATIHKIANLRNIWSGEWAGIQNSSEYKQLNKELRAAKKIKSLKEVKVVEAKIKKLHQPSTQKFHNAVENLLGEQKYSVYSKKLPDWAKL